MTYRAISAIIFALIVAVEIYLYLQEKPEYKTIPGERIGNSTWYSQPKGVIDYDAKRSKDQKYIIVLGSTILVGGIVTFAVPNTKVGA